MPIARLTPSHASTYRALILEAYALHPDAFTSTEAECSDLPDLAQHCEALCTRNYRLNTTNKLFAGISNRSVNRSPASAA